MPIKSKVITVALAVEETLPRAGLDLLMKSQPAVAIVAEGSLHDAARLAAACKPDIVLVHTATVSANITAILTSICKSAPQSSIVVLGRERDHAYLSSLFRAGASGYVLLQTTPRDLLKAIHAVARGCRYIDPELGADLIDWFINREANAGKPLSRREAEVLELVARGYTLSQIAAKLDLSRKSVETYQCRLREKLSLHTRAELVRYALETGLLARESLRHDTLLPLELPCKERDDAESEDDDLNRSAKRYYIRAWATWAVAGLGASSLLDSSLLAI
jgi:two-component system, NarL family, response regulator NreC